MGWTTATGWSDPGPRDRETDIGGRHAAARPAETDALICALHGENNVKRAQSKATTRNVLGRS
jgi:hypothetical protein